MSTFTYVSAGPQLAYQQLCSIDPASLEQKLGEDEMAFDSLLLGLAK